MTLTLRKGGLTDSFGNGNAQQSIARPWDITAPVIESVSATEGSYTTGDQIVIEVRYSEIVNVDTAKGSPFLALSNGQMAVYEDGSETDTLVFVYTVQAGDEATNLDVLALVKNGSSIVDMAGNDGMTSIGAGKSLAAQSMVDVDGVAPVIVTISAESGLYMAGDTVDIEVQFSEAVTLDTTSGSPILALDNGAYAEYVEGSGTPYLTFRYTVQANDFDSEDLDVNALAENGAVMRDDSGNAANVVIRNELNTLAYRSDVSIDAAKPYIKTISANAGSYKAGDVIDIALGWSKPVAMDDTLGVPDLVLNNGAIASYNAQASTPTRLVFTYTVSANDAETAGTTEDQLAIAQFRSHYASFAGIVAGIEADVSIPNGGLLADDGVFVDLTLPSVDHIDVADAVLTAGETTTVTVVLSEAVKSLSPDYFSYTHGVLGQFATEDGVTWTATFTPTRDTDSSTQIITLNEAYLSDLASNYGAMHSSAVSLTVDSAYPTVCDPFGCALRSPPIKMCVLW